MDDSSSTGTHPMLDALRGTPHVAYFSMELALEPSIPTYSGGLGVLAGDLMRTAADLALPMVAVTLASRRGYVRQRIEDGAQVDEPQPWDPASAAVRVPVKVPVSVERRTVWVSAWCYRVQTQCVTGRAMPVLLLDTDLPENAPADRGITDVLYGDGPGLRIRQEIVLGIGGLRLLHALGARVLKYHMNEGHAAFLALELLAAQRAAHQGEEAVEAVRRQCVFTTHTPVASGHDRFDWALVAECLGEPVDAALMRRLAGEQDLNMTLLALNLSGWINGVAQRHAELSREMFPGYVVHAITNGVHAWTWASDAHRALFDRFVPHWCVEPEMLLHGSGRIPDDALEGAHRDCKQALLDHVADAVPGARLSAEVLTIGFARRMTAYKRPHLLFEDLARLRAIARRHPLQVLVSGKAHPADTQGKREIETLHAIARQLEGEVPVVFLPDYGMASARLLVAGCDVWLNTPRPPLEASGTSGMKAAFNGVPQLSVLDGWWLEGWEEGVTGWSIDDTGSDAGDALSLYGKLEGAIAPLYYEQRAGWTALMRNVIGRNGALFNSHRMLRHYQLEAYSR
ncbi:alpha-glucan family phosphorylase [Ramlibacter sp. MMS24-I3-19]|uniref:alpha-glucan family phosphorylase n=1 Tax=Ramlibacter sp. MMS24-I3-19 TaxID=3416606 RepID=UPI003D010FC9